jgi:hypothetical protein
MENPLTPEKARNIADWLDVCDKYVLSFAERDPEMTPETHEQVVEFFGGKVMQVDLRGYADWYETHEGDTHDEVR